MTASTGISVTAATSITIPIPSASLLPPNNCYQDNPERALQGLHWIDVDKNFMTLPICHTFCAGFVFYGLNNGNECFCGNILQVVSEPAAQGGCNVPCAGDGSANCGGYWYMNVYQV
jgi:hypothetical protein